MPTPERPVLAGPWKLIGPNPELSDVLPGDEAHRVAFEKGREKEHNAAVDHHIVRDEEGIFHLWGCVRATEVGRVLYHWKSRDVEAEPWESTGEIIRADESAGESVDDWFGQEYIQSPYFVHDDGVYYMFYGGHRAGVQADGTPVPGARARAAAAPGATSVESGRGETGTAWEAPASASAPANPSAPATAPRPAESAGVDSTLGPGTDPSLHQICLMTSPNGRDWTRHRNADGTSRLFLGPGETRDPCVLKIGDSWHMYYAGYYDYERPDEGAGFVVRTSTDLVSWSDWTLVHRDPRFGASRTDTECPFVVERNGFFYLFRTVDYYYCRTLVFRSDDPFDFGVGDASDKLVARLPCAAPELYEFDGVEYVSSSHTPLEGEQLARLGWVADG